MPAAIAPEETITTSEPAFIRASIASASPASRPASNIPVGVVNAVVPTLTTTRRAVRIASRALMFGAHWSYAPLLLIASLCIVAGATLAACGLAFGGPDALGAVQARVGAAARQLNIHACGCLGLPVKCHVADGDCASRLGAEPQQFVLDAEPSQSVTQIADRLVIVEVGLRDPAFGPLAAHHESALPVGLHGETSLVDRDGADHRPPWHHHRLGRVIFVDHVGQREDQRLQAFSRRRGNRE